LQQNCQVADDDSVSVAATAVVRNGIPGLRYDQLPDSELISAAEGVAARLRFAVGVNGQADRIEILSGTPESTSTRIRGKQALETWPSRPGLRDGRAQRTPTVTMPIYRRASGKLLKRIYRGCSGTTPASVNAEISSSENPAPRNPS